MDTGLANELAPGAEPKLWRLPVAQSSNRAIEQSNRTVESRPAAPTEFGPVGLPTCSGDTSVALLWRIAQGPGTAFAGTSSLARPSPGPVLSLTSCFSVQHTAPRIFYILTAPLNSDLRLGLFLAEQSLDTLLPTFNRHSHWRTYSYQRNCTTRTYHQSTTTPASNTTKHPTAPTITLFRWLPEPTRAAPSESLPSSCPPRPTTTSAADASGAAARRGPATSSPSGQKSPAPCEDAPPDGHPPPSASSPATRRPP